MNIADRAAEIAAFLSTAGWRADAARPLAGDASNRRYLRLAPEEGCLGAVLMDAPPASGEDVRPFVAMTHWLRQQGLSAPEIAAADTARGFLLLEDLGDDLFTRLLATTLEGEAELYGAAVDLLAELAVIPAPGVLGPEDCRVELAPYDRAVLAREAALIREWWMPAATGVIPSRDLAAEFDALVAEATATVEPVRDVLVLRDYHADNLVWLPQRAGSARVGLLDYQDALAGHGAYDLVSLLEDARRDTSAELREAMIVRYLERRAEVDAAAFRAAYAALGAQRNLKIVGIFARLAIRDGKPRYLGLIPRVWGHVIRDLSHPALATLAAWVARHVPAPEPQVLAKVAAVAGAAK
ncbi:MAG TPA: phosphotransferase [Thermohalobaculum sp.]|nr:phosphotransferase [Thermohalobaculum sp.]